MIDHVRDLASLREATERLLAATGKLDNAGVTEQSRLPGWSRGHVLAHLSRNADALVNILEGRPMYVSAEAREADIERDASRPLDIQLADIRDSDARFRQAADAPADWSRTVTMRNGVTDVAARLPFRRLIEIELHHVDLDIGYELEDLPESFTGREIEFLTERFSGHPDVPSLVLTAADGRQWRTGGTGDATRLAVNGSPAALLGWLAGRGAKGADLETGGAPLPPLPPL
ncbi:maleylpyruvate isomerase family mycothiol-dependent enzyme [Streptomyces sp. NPDC051219]|uniref:maleylpyruvate isomerase family mycothiol-dependent enzyme n=1 Tax=Streptomyces sp. NPDC051219 TaxID=3155283 RepID=UPI0034256951